MAALLNPTFCQRFLLHTALAQSEASRTTCIQQEDKLRAVSLEHSSLYTRGEGRIESGRVSHSESRVHELSQ